MDNSVYSLATTSQARSTGACIAKGHFSVAAFSSHQQAQSCPTAVGRRAGFRYVDNLTWTKKKSQRQSCVAEVSIKYAPWRAECRESAASQQKLTLQSALSAETAATNSKVHKQVNSEKSGCEPCICGCHCMDGCRRSLVGGRSKGYWMYETTLESRTT